MTDPTIPTPIVPPTSTRTSVTIAAVADTVMMKLAGLVVFTASGYFEYREVVVPPSHTAHLILFAASAAVGCAMMFGKAFLGAVSGLLGLVAPFLGKFGGKS